MVTWKEDIIKALENLGGVAHRSKLHDEVERISSKFKKIMHRENVGEQGKNEIDSHSFYQLTINQSIDYFYLTKTGHYNHVVKFCDNLSEKEFINEIVQFKSARGY